MADDINYSKEELDRLKEFNSEKEKILAGLRTELEYKEELRKTQERIIELNKTENFQNEEELNAIIEKIEQEKITIDLLKVEKEKRLELQKELRVSRQQLREITELRKLNNSELKEQIEKLEEQKKQLKDNNEIEIQFTEIDINTFIFNKIFKDIKFTI